MIEEDVERGSVGEAVVLRRLADLFLFGAGYFLAGPDERSHALLADPAWRAALVDAALLEDAAENCGASQLERHLRQFSEFFRIPGPRYVAPMEQAYRGEKATVEASAVGECQAIYAAAGYDPAPFSATQADHIGHQLRFLHAVLVREGDCVARGDATAATTAASWRRGFVREHAQWWPEMAQRAMNAKPCAEMRTLLGLVQGLARHAGTL